jgi:hypothetical protein
MNHVEEPELQYALRVMPPGRGGYRRWRWELWHGPRLLATGWRMSERHAERALRTAASRFAHRVLGLHPLRPELAAATGAFAPGAAVRIQSGAVSCRLVPREAWLAAGSTSRP